MSEEMDEVGLELTVLTFRGSRPTVHHICPPPPPRRKLIGARMEDMQLTFLCLLPPALCMNEMAWSWMRLSTGDSYRRPAWWPISTRN
jgi:hypothetical protein